MKIIVFDIGGTLMEYKGMPYSWIDYYREGFYAINKKYQCNASEALIEESVSILKSYNPRLNYREIEYTPQHIFGEAIRKWNTNCPLDEIIYSFYESLNLKPMIYEETISTLTKIKERGYKIAALTDLPTGMTDAFFQKDIGDLLQYFDLYVSSLICGYRKPNPYGLEYIAMKFGVDCKELLFVGDEEKDRNTANNAGCDFFKITRDEGIVGNSYPLQDVVKYIDTVN